MNNPVSFGTAAVLALTISCARAEVRPAGPQVQASAAAAQTAAGVTDQKAGPAQYAGEYQINGATMTIRARGDQLVREMSGQPDQVLEPIGNSETRFRVGTSQAELEFRADKTGGVTVILQAGKHQARGVRVRRA